MPELIVGHTTHDSTLLWLRGDRRWRWARVELVDEDGRRRTSDDQHLLPEDDYIGLVWMGGLGSGRRYQIVAEFAFWDSQLGSRRMTRLGSVRSFPDPRVPSRFSFLLGSCNLAAARITAMGAYAAGTIGLQATRLSAKRPAPRWVGRWRPLHGVIRRIAPWLSLAGWYLVKQANRFQPTETLLTSPFRALLMQLRQPPGRAPAFMIHAGDQIYFDIDLERRRPDREEYRRAYRQAWFEDDDSSDFLASCPHYMILDDHEIVDGYDATPGKAKFEAHAEPAFAAYREYVHWRHPFEPGATGYNYRFRCGGASFYVLDTRSARNADKGWMLGENQLPRFLEWLGRDPGELKFVVTSVPFVARLRPPGDGQPDERGDKWCGESFRGERDAIVDRVVDAGVERLVFLTGDMHCAYHASLRVGTKSRQLVVHELAGGPVNQLEFARRSRFCDQYDDVTARGRRYSGQLHGFHASAPSVTRVTVDPNGSPTLRWEIVRTAKASGDHDDRRAPPLQGHLAFSGRMGWAR